MKRLRKLLRYGQICLLILVVLAATVAIDLKYSSTSIDDQLITKHVPDSIKPKLHEYPEDKIFKIFGYSKSDYSVEEYKALLDGKFAIVSFVSIGLGALSTVLSTIMALYSAKTIDSFDVETINTLKQEDLEIMSNAYDSSEDVIVFSGDFDWIVSSHKIKGVVEKLINKDGITFISFKDEASVQKSIGQTKYLQIANKKRLKVLNDNKNLHFSIIDYGASCEILYLHKEGKVSKMISIKDEGDCKYLLKIIRSLADKVVSSC